MILSYEVICPIEGVIEHIHAMEGDFVQQGDLLFSIQCEESVQTVHSATSGYITQIEVQPGDEVIPGMILIILREQV